MLCCCAGGGFLFILFLLFAWLAPDKWFEETEEEKKTRERIKREQAKLNYEMALKTYEYLMEEKEKGAYHGNPTKPDPSKYFLS